MKHLVLVGPMGAGKTTVGARVAQRLGRPFVDTDDLVTAGTKKTVAELFAEQGEDGFRAFERAAVADACAAPDPLVIACGGGAVVDADSRRRLAAAGMVIWLDAPGATLAERVGDDTERPLLGEGDPAVTLDRIRDLRAPAYEAVADVRVDTNGRTVDEVVDVVVTAMGEAA